MTTTRREAAITPVAYELSGALYLNITNRCTNRCQFCLRQYGPGVGGHDLWLEREPGAAAVVDAIGDPLRYREVVFCGYGEPLLRLDVVLAVCRFLKERGAAVRVDTNGQANLVHGRNIVADLAGVVDRVSISLNAHTAGLYNQLCRPRYGEAAYQAVLDFARESRRFIPEVTLSVVEFGPVDVKRCREIADELGVGFRVRRHRPGF